jgi:hypothetical protein
VDNDVNVVQELIDEETVSEILMERNDIWWRCGTWGQGRPRWWNVITVTEAVNMVWSRWCLVMTRKDVPDHMLANSETLQEFTEKSLLKQAVQKKWDFFYEVNMVRLSLSFLTHFPCFEKMKVGLCDLHAVCLWIPPPLTFEWQNQSLWNMVHIYGTWAYLNGVLHKSLPSVCVSVCVSLLPLLGKGSVKGTPLHC